MGPSRAASVRSSSRPAAPSSTAARSSASACVRRGGEGGGRRQELGLKGLLKDAVFHVKQVELNSVSDDMCIAVGDEILAINLKPLTKELLNSIIIKKNKSVVLKVKRRFETIDLELVFKNRYHYPKFSVSRLEKRSDRSKMLFDKWLDI